MIGCPSFRISDDASRGRAPYGVGVSNGTGEDLIDKFAPADVRATVRWLKDVSRSLAMNAQRAHLRNCRQE
jgi:hypothetical protein